MVYTHLSLNQFEKTLKMAQDAVEAYNVAVDELTHLVCMKYPDCEEADFIQIQTLQTHYLTNLLQFMRLHSFPNYHWLKHNLTA